LQTPRQRWHCYVSILSSLSLIYYSFDLLINNGKRLRTTCTYRPWRSILKHDNWELAALQEPYWKQRSMGSSWVMNVVRWTKILVHKIYF
jgi:hypothetical protein